MKNFVDKNISPFFLSFSALFVTFGIVLWIHIYEGGLSLLYSGLLILVLICAYWWRDRKPTFDGRVFAGLSNLWGITSKVSQGWEWYSGLPLWQQGVIVLGGVAVVGAAAYLVSRGCEPASAGSGSGTGNLGSDPLESLGCSGSSSGSLASEALVQGILGAPEPVVDAIIAAPVPNVMGPMFDRVLEVIRATAEFRHLSPDVLVAYGNQSVPLLLDIQPYQVTAAILLATVMWKVPAVGMSINDVFPGLFPPVPYQSGFESLAAGVENPAGATLHPSPEEFADLIMPAFLNGHMPNMSPYLEYMCSQPVYQLPGIGGLNHMQIVVNRLNLQLPNYGAYLQSPEGLVLQESFARLHDGLLGESFGRFHQAALDLLF